MYAVVKVRVNAGALRFPHLLFSASVVPPPGFKYEAYYYLLNKSVILLTFLTVVLYIPH